MKSKKKLQGRAKLVKELEDYAPYQVHVTLHRDENESKNEYNAKLLRKLSKQLSGVLEYDSAEHYTIIYKFSFEDRNKAGRFVKKVQSSFPVDLDYASMSEAQLEVYYQDMY